MSFFTIASGLSASFFAFASIAFVASAPAQVPPPRSPNSVEAFFTPRAGANTVILVWSGAHVESDSVWMGYRVRRTVKGISPIPFEAIGQYRAKDTVTSACLASSQPCDLSKFVFYGRGLFFKGFRQNRVNGSYILNYPPGAPADSCDSCRVFVDQANLGGFTSEYAVTSIDTVRYVDPARTDFVESAINPAEIATVEPSAPPADDLERVAVVPNPFKGRAEWDPAAGDNHVHFIHLPAGSTVRIFTSNAELVRVLKQDPNANAGGVTGDLDWDLKNADGRNVGSGIYIYQVESPQGHEKRGHFVIIR